MVQHKTLLCSRLEEKNHCPACHMQSCELPRIITSIIVTVVKYYQ